MTFRHWLRGTVALALLAGCCATASAQGKLTLSPDESNRFLAIKAGERRVREDRGEEEKNRAAIRRKAQVEVNLMIDAAETAQGSSDAKMISAMVRRLSEVIVDPVKVSREKLTEGQRDMIEVFGKEMVEQLKAHIGTADKPSGDDILIKINAARQLSILGKSGYGGACLYAADVISDPKQHDAVKIYALQAIRNFFSVPNLDGKEGYSNLGGGKAEDELAPITALINFIKRKPAFEQGAPEEEVDAFRYLRREAVAALAATRRAVVRDKESGKLAEVPAIWLLRIANADTTLPVTPNLAERSEALAGYLNLLGEKDQNMDYAAWYVATAVRDLTIEYKAAKAMERPKLDDKEKQPPPGRPDDRDKQGWRYAAVRFQIGLRMWRENYENPLHGVRPQNVKSMLTDLDSRINKNILDYMATARRSDVTLTQLEEWMKSSTFTSKLLFDADQSTVISRSDAGR